VTPAGAPVTHRPVLVVDDDADIRASVAEILRGQGYVVREAEDGDEALAMIGRERFALMVLDMGMPRRDGVGVLDALADLPPVVVMSAHSLPGQEKSWLGPKVRSYLKKPFPPRKLIDEVADILSGAEGGV